MPADDVSERRAEVDARISKLTRKVQTYLEDVERQQQTQVSQQELAKMKSELDHALTEKRELESTMESHVGRIQQLVRMRFFQRHSSANH